MHWGSLKLEITLAMLIKVLLLVGLWFVVFRFNGKRPDPQPDIADHFQLGPVAEPAAPSSVFPPSH